MRESFAKQGDKMKKYRNIAVALTALFMVSTLNATVGVFNFENVSATTTVVGSYTGDIPNWYSNNADVSQTISTTGITGTLQTGYFYGGVISNSTSNAGTNYMQDCNSMLGGGAKGSSMYGVMLPFDMMNASGIAQTETISGKVFESVYSTNINVVEPISIVFSEAISVSAIDLSLTAYTHYSLDKGDGFVGKQPMQNEGTFLAVRIYALNSNNAIDIDNSVDVMLAENSAGEITIQNGWKTIDLLKLSENNQVNGLAFQVFSNMGNNYGLTIPAYVAIDNITYVIPEPSDFAMIFGALALAIVALKKFLIKR